MFGKDLILAGFGGHWEWIIILLVVLLLFGRRLPGVARSLGQGISSFKKGLNDPLDEDSEDDKKSGKKTKAKSDDENEDAA